MSLFTNDAMSTYTNVDTDAFIEIMSKYLLDNASCFGYDIEALIGAIVIAMRNNICNFGDIIQCQIKGITGYAGVSKRIGLFKSGWQFEYHVSTTSLMMALECGCIMLTRMRSNVFGINSKMICQQPPWVEMGILQRRIDLFLPILATKLIQALACDHVRREYIANSG